MKEQTKKNPGALAGATGVKSTYKATKLRKQTTHKTGSSATRSFFWDRKSNSIQSLRDLAGAVAA
jgi:hypothetical protein